MPTIASIIASLVPPFRDKLVDGSGAMTSSWTSYFSLLTKMLSPLGVEKSYQLKNNLAVAESIAEMSFNFKAVSQAVIEFYIQRVTSGVGSTEIITTGVMHVAYKPTSNSWVLVTIGTPGPSTSGLTFSITSDGQVQYTSSNVTGTPSISKITWRARTLAAKNYQYSTQAGK